MTYVTEQTSAELRAHMRRLQAIPGWHNPLDDRLFKEIQALDAEIAALRSTLPPIAITAEEAGREGEAKDAALANNCGDFAKLTEEVARDAMRYRCIRNVKGPFEVSMHGAMFWNEGLDAVADAAMLPSAPAQRGGQG